MSLSRPVAAIVIIAALAGVAMTAAAAPLAVTSCDIETSERIVAIGDVHGAYDAFVQILRAAGLVDDRQRWSGGKAHVVQVGDVVDRGPDSRKALDLLRRLESEAAAAGGAVHLLLGNHEVMRTLGDLRFVTPGEYGAFANAQSEDVRQNFVRQAKPDARQELLKATPPGLVELRVAFGRDGQYGKLLRARDPVLKINSIVFVHGGLSPAVAPMSCASINATVHRELSDDIEKTRAAPLASLAAREDGPMWYRGLADLPEPAVADILAKAHARAIVAGHNVVPGGRIVSRFDGKVFEIDTGMQVAYVPAGRPSALEIRDGVFTAIYTDSREVLPGPAR
jgi:hypothetical protein